MSTDLPKVSVVTITYGHEKYITETLDGVLMQQYDGPVEFIIANDNSPDATDQVMKKYFLEKPAPRNFEIKYTKHETNKGVMSNFLWSLKQASGKYIALCEGDDYWIDPLKLQKQVVTLENNPTINICTHPSLRLYGDDLKKDSYGYWGDLPKVISAKQVIRNYASTAGFQSIIIRNLKIDEFSEIIKNLLGAHSTIQMFYAIPHGLCYLPDYMSVYRIGSTSSISTSLFKNDGQYLEKQKKNWQGLILINHATGYKFDKELKISLRYRALNAIGTGFLSFEQKIKLITDYSLYKSPNRLIKTLLFRYYNSIRKLYKKITLGKFTKS